MMLNVSELVKCETDVHESVNISVEALDADMCKNLSVDLKNWYSMVSQQS